MGADKMNRSMKSNIDRSNLFDVPSYTKMISVIKGIKDNAWIRPAAAILLATGCRVGELLYLKRGNIKFIDYHNKEIPNDQLILSNVATIQFNMSTEKNRKSKYRVVPLIKNELFLDLVEIIVDYCKNIKYDETLMFPYTRGSVWYSIKRNIGKDFFPHYLRHINVTNDTRSGVSLMVQKTKYGWTDTRPGSVYSHLNYLDILNEQKKAFGEPNKKEEIYKVIDANVEARKEYNQERKFNPTPVENERAVLMESAAHPEPSAPPTKEDTTISKIVQTMKSMPEYKEKMEEKPETVTLPIDDPTFVKEVRKYPEPKFNGPQLPKPTPITKQFDTINKDATHLFKPGMIVGNKVIIAETGQEKIDKIKQKYDPNKVIPVLVENKAYAARIANLRKVQKKKEDDANQLVAVV